jgi:hypothetical protein
MVRQYDNSWRRLTALANAAKRDLAKKSREQYPGHPNGGLPLKVRRMRARVKRIPKDFKCPECRQVKLHHRQWVIGKSLLHDAVCLSCYRKGA